MSKLGTMLQVGRAFGVRDGMRRLEYEFQRSSGLLSWKMRSVQGWDSWDLKRITHGIRAEAEANEVQASEAQACNVQAKEMLHARRGGSAPFFFTDARTVGASLKKIVGVDGEESILAEANGILAGSLPFFGQLSFSTGFPPQWFRNPVTGQTVSPVQPWTQMRFASPAYGDLKFILEPSRFLFVYPLVRAYALSGDERFPQAFWTAIEDWARQSPPMSGPLWICGQECSLRILAWSFALHGFINSPSTTSERVATLVSMIAAHAWRTAQTLGYARSQRSNHLISEAVGLWTAGILYPELREAQVWQNLGEHLLLKAVLDQITPEGFSQQHSFNYQRMILHLLFWTLRLAEIHEIPLPQEIRSRTQAAFDFMAGWVDPRSGFAPNYGADDGSLILPLARGEYRDFRPLLQLGAAVLHRPALPYGPWDESPLWFGAELSATRKMDLPPPTATSRIETGYFRLGDENSWALIRAGRYTRRPFQADQLHVDLWWQGINLARDAGTYLYNGPSPWNNAFAGTAVHNTVMVDHRDQMRRAGRFLWLDWAQASGRLYSSPNHACADCFQGEHDGYRRVGVKHRRTVQFLAGAGWAIVDDLQGSGVHDLRLHWLTADFPHQISQSPFQVSFTSGQGSVRWSILASVPGSGAVLRAGKSEISARAEESSSPQNEIAAAELLGWESPTYGALKPAVSLIYLTRSELPVRFVTLILTDDRSRVEAREGDVVILQTESIIDPSRKTEIYRVSMSGKKHGPEPLAFPATATIV